MWPYKKYCRGKILKIARSGDINQKPNSEIYISDFQNQSLSVHVLLCTKVDVTNRQQPLITTKKYIKFHANHKGNHKKNF